MDEELAMAEAGLEWQSRWLVWGMGVTIFSVLGLNIFSVVGMGVVPSWFFVDAGVSAGFAWLVWRIRASTGGGAMLGGAICLKLLLKMRFGLTWTQTAIPALIVLLALTFAATRFGRRGRAARTAEEMQGRRASQVVANLGIVAMMGGSIELGIFLGGLAALAEAAADTMSSEMGKALGRRTVSITTGRAVAAGTDGGVSLAGSACGIAAAAMVACVPVWLGGIDGLAGAVVFVAGCAGMVFDSLLGATAERLGWLGNDIVNFASTFFAAGLAYEASRFFVPPQPYW